MHNTLLRIFLILKSKSENSYLVGGCVRDELLGLPVKDYDIVTDSVKIYKGWICEAGIHF